MGKSLNRVKRALEDHAMTSIVRETGVAKTAQQAADALGCGTDQIAKSIIFSGSDTGALYLFLTAGGRQVDMEQAAVLAGEPLQKADAATVRSVTGFAIGGVSPLGHLTPITAFIDETLFGFAVIYAAAGTPNHVFDTTASELATASGALRASFSTQM